MKKGGKLRIFIYGTNAKEDYNILSKNLNTNFYQDKKYCIRPSATVNKKTNWEYFLFPGEINEEKNKTIREYLINDMEKENNNMLKVEHEISEIYKKFKYQDIDSLNEIFSEIIFKYSNFYDILIISVDHILDKDSILAFKFFQNLGKPKQPIILFLTKKEKNPNVLQLFKFITNEYFDKRNIYAYKFSSNEEEIENINNFLIKCMNYYNNLGNTNMKNNSQYFNILICGPSGTGKSTFINQFLHEKAAKEASGLQGTLYLTSYTHPVYPIRIYDTQGFENQISIDMILKIIKKFDKDINDSTNNIDLIIYFNELNERCFFQMEIDLIKYLLKENKKILFVLNNKSNSLRKSYRLIEQYKKSLINIINTMKESEKSKLYEYTDNFVLVQLKQKIYEDEEEEEDENDYYNLKIKQCYGMDKLFMRIYEMFKEHKISIPEIHLCSDVKDFIWFFNKYELFKNLRIKEDTYLNRKIEASKIIMSYSGYGLLKMIFKDSKRKELLDEINKIFYRKERVDIDDLFTIIENEVNEANNVGNTHKIINEFLNSIERLRGCFDTYGFKFDTTFCNDTTILYGCLYLKKLEPPYGEYNEKTKLFLIDLCTTLNKAIDGFLEISKEWEEIYKSLNSHKSNKEWVNKFFFLEIPRFKYNK